MNEEMTINEKLALERLYKSVAHRIASGDSKEIIIADLVKEGWNTESAIELFDNIEETIEDYEEHSEEWKRKKARQYILPMLMGALFLIGGIAIFVYSLISPEFEYILPIGLMAFGFITFFYALSKWLRFKK